MQSPVPPADVGGQCIPSDGSHVGWHRSVSGQPVGIVVTRSIAAVTLRVTEQEGHGGETGEAASHGAWGTVSWNYSSKQKRHRSFNRSLHGGRFFTLLPRS